MARPDVAVVSIGTTLGLRAAERQLYDGLKRLGVNAFKLSTSYGLSGLAIGRTNLADFSVMTALRVLVDRAGERVNPRAFIFPSSLAAAMQSDEVLGRSAVRFDSLAVQNRPGWKGTAQRVAEHRALQHAKLLMPMSLHAATDHGVTLRRPIAPLPMLVEASRVTIEPRRNRVVLYASNPFKKGLALAVQAWNEALIWDWEMLIIGIAPEIGRRFLGDRDIPVPRTVKWAGIVSGDEARRLFRSSRLFLNASHFEDFGVTPLEALLDGAIVVSTPTRGPAEALPILRRLAPDTVAFARSSTSLACALERAVAMDDASQDAYRTAAARMIRPYLQDGFDAMLRDRVLPSLLD